MNMKKEIEKIAEEYRIDTLKTQNSDTLDFHDLAVWQIKDMLEKAYKAGKAA